MQQTQSRLIVVKRANHVHLLLCKFYEIFSITVYNIMLPLQATDFFRRPFGESGFPSSFVLLRITSVCHVLVWRSVQNGHQQQWTFGGNCVDSRA